MRWLGLMVVVVLAFALAVVLGPAHVSLADLTTSDVVRSLRVPRALLAFLVGGSLGVAGAGLQALVRNPLADPFLLGLSGGGGLARVWGLRLLPPGPWALRSAASSVARAALGSGSGLGSSA